MSGGISGAHSVLPPEAKLFVPLLVGCRDNAAITCGDDLPRMKRETGDISMWLTDLFPLALPIDFTADCAGRIFNDWQRITLTDINNRREIAGHSHLVDTQDGLGAIRDCSFDQRRIDIESLWLDVHKYRSGTAIPYAAGGSYERMADGNDFVAGTNAHSEQCEMQGDCAI